MKKFVLVSVICFAVIIIISSCQLSGGTKESSSFETTATEEITTTGDYHLHHVMEESIPPTCVETGYYRAYCQICGAELHPGKIIQATGHTPVIDEAVPPTFTETGLTEGSHCSVCGEILVKQEVVPIVNKYDYALDFGKYNCYQIVYSRRDESGYELSHYDFMVDGGVLYAKHVNEGSYIGNDVGTYYIKDDQSGRLLVKLPGASFGAEFVDQADQEYVRNLTLKEIIQNITGGYDHNGIIFLSKNELTDYLTKLNDLYQINHSQEKIDEEVLSMSEKSIFLSEYDKLVYEENDGAYSYHGENCDIKYFFDGDNIVKIEYSYTLYGQKYKDTIEVSYNKIGIVVPDMIYEMVVQCSIHVRSGENRNVISDSSVFNVDLSNGHFVLLNDELGSFNEATNTLTVGDKEISAYLCFISGSKVYSIRYDNYRFLEN